MTDSECCSPDDGVDAEAAASNFVNGPFGAAILNHDACWFDRPCASICCLAAIAPLLAMVATTMAPPENV